MRCVSDEPWVTAAETAECALALAAVGDEATATDLLRWTRAHRHDDGVYWTGIVYPEGVTSPAASAPPTRAPPSSSPPTPSAATTAASGIFTATDYAYPPPRSAHRVTSAPHAPAVAART